MADFITSDPSETILDKLVELLSTRNAIDLELANITGRSSRDGDIGEFLASLIFRINLNTVQNQAGHDGVFLEGSLKGKTVNVKYYRNKTNYIDMNKDGLHPDYYMVVTGRLKSALSDVTWHIKYVYIFETTELLGKRQSY